MENYSKSVVQLQHDISTLTTRRITAEALDLTELRLITGLNEVGLKDGSGSNGDIFQLDSSAYIKMKDFWWTVPCVSCDNFGA